jgi:hypothetical protein
LKVTVVRVGVEQGPELVVEEEEWEEVREGQAVFVAVLQGPVAEPREQDVGRRACKIVSKTEHERFRLGEKYRRSTPRSRHGG